MKGKFLTAFVLALAITTVPRPLPAHHGNAAYDDTRSVTLKGTVTRWDWANPHCVLQLDVSDDSGQVVPWVVETENPTSMTNVGWTKTSMKPGDQVTVTALPAKNGKHVGRIVDILLPSGQRLSGKAQLKLGEDFKK